MEFSLSKVLSTVKDQAAKVVQRVALPNSDKTAKGPQLNILRDVFDTDKSRLIYLGFYYFYHGFVRIVSLWVVYNWLSGLHL